MSSTSDDSSSVQDTKSIFDTKSVFDIDGDWTPNLLFNHKKLYQLS